MNTLKIMVFIKKSSAKKLRRVVKRRREEGKDYDGEDYVTARNYTGIVGCSND